MTSVPAGSLVRYSTIVRRRFGGSSFFGPVSGRSSGGSAEYVTSGAAPGGAPLGPGPLGPLGPTDAGGRKMSSGFGSRPGCGRLVCVGGSLSYAPGGGG